MSVARGVKRDSQGRIIHRTLLVVTIGIREAAAEVLLKEESVPETRDSHIIGLLMWGGSMINGCRGGTEGPMDYRHTSPGLLLG